MNALSDMHSTSPDVSLSGVIQNKGVASQHLNLAAIQHSSDLYVSTR